jgi:hypothetical protein
MSSSPHHRGIGIDEVDPASDAGIYLRATRDSLVAQLKRLHRNLTTAQRLLVDRVAWQSWRLEQFERRMLDGREFTFTDGRTYGALNNGIRCNIRALGLLPPPPRPEREPEQHWPSWESLVLDAQLRREEKDAAA